MSLLRDIQKAAIDPQVDVTVLLRMCKVLAARLKNPQFNNWVDQELNGYTDTNSLPDYRILSVYSKGHFFGPFGSGIKNADIPLLCIEEKYRKNLEISYCMQPISSYCDLLIGSKKTDFSEPWPPDLVALIGKDIYKQMNCGQAWKVIPRGSIVGLVDAVRNRILSFVLEIEVEAPEAGEAPPDTTPIPQERVTCSVYNQIYGNVGNIAQGNQQVTQTATITVNKNDIASLKTFLTSLGIPAPRIEDLETALQADSEDVKKNRCLGARVREWLGSLVLDIGQGIIPILQTVDANLITQAILIYYGLK